ncbi:hypothetical protein RB201_25880 [Streptomyces sp. S1A(2023)]
MAATAASDGGGTTSSRAVLARICVEMEEILTLAGAAGEAAGLEAERILGVLREGGDVAGAQGDLHRLLRRVGVAAGLNGITRGAGVGGLPAVRGHPVAPPVLVCPVGRCSRAVLLDDPPQVPRECRLHAQRLRRLDSSA